MKEAYSIIPERIMKNLLAYVDHGQPVGGFLTSVLSNDLFKSVVRADDEILPLLPLLVHFIHWELPMTCHGSLEHVENWIKKKREQNEK